jgi:SH3 domain protein
MPGSGTAVQILDSNGDWSRIRLLEGKMSGKEGWVLSRYLMTRLPWEKQSALLKNETRKLKEKMPLVENKLKETLHREKNLIIKLRDNNKALETLQGEYTSLKQGSADYLKLKEKYDVTHSALKTAQEKVRKLAEENKIMKSSQGLRWFLAGALVLFFGLVIGVIIGKRQKKQRSTLIS